MKAFSISELHHLFLLFLLFSSGLYGISKVGQGLSSSFFLLLRFVSTKWLFKQRVEKQRFDPFCGLWFTFAGFRCCIICSTGVV